ncbi:MAG: PQQ-binding-like beta-propeller repeat protein [Pseudomonadales bacterium]
MTFEQRRALARQGRPAGAIVRGILLLAAGCAPLTAIGATGDQDWRSYGGAPGGGHFSTAREITPDNVGTLALAWQHRSGDIRKPGGGQGRARTQSAFQATPIVVDDTLYYCSPFNKVFALNAATGEERWSYDPGVDHDADVLPNCRGVSSWRSGAEGFCEHRIIMGTLDARLIALDAATGKPCPDFGDGGAVDLTRGMTAHGAAEYSVTSPPAILGDMAITGAMVLDNVRRDAPSGVVRAYDVRSGALRWVWNPVPAEIAPLNADGTYRAGTTNVWSIIAVDPERNLVFVPTGNTQPDYYGGHRDGLDAYSSSVVALNGATGALVWHYQLVHHDLWDYDTPAQPTLMDLRVDGASIPALVQVTKMGMTFVLNRETGEPVWPVEERAVPQDPVPGEYLAPTQPFPTHLPHLIEHITEDDAWGFTPWDRGACRRAIAALRNDGIYTPPSLEGTLFYPGNGGGNNWGSPAIHPGEQLAVVVTMRVPSFVKLIPRDQCAGQRLAAAGHALLRADRTPLITARRALHRAALGNPGRHRPGQRRPPLERAARDDARHGTVSVLVDQGRARHRRADDHRLGAGVRRRHAGSRVSRIRSGERR